MTETQMQAIKEKLIGGMAFPRGVLFLTEERLAAGYYDPEGQLRLYTQELDPKRFRFRWAGQLGGLLRLPLVSWWAVWRIEPDREAARAVLAGIPIGLALGLWLRWAVDLPLGVKFLLSMVPLVLLYLFSSTLRQGIRQIQRYHAAEHMAAHALERGDLSLSTLRAQPMLHPSCGSNLFVLLLPGLLLAHFLPWWLLPLLILPSFNLFVWINKNPQHPLASRLLALGYLGQRYTLAPPEDRELLAALKALEGLVGHKRGGVGEL